MPFSARRRPLTERMDRNVADAPPVGSDREAPRGDADRSSHAFTLGYQGRSLEEVLEVVVHQRIELVVDVRENARSRRPGFSGDELRRALETVGVAYAHLPELGCEAASRHALWSGGPTGTFLERYRVRLAARPLAFADLVGRVRDRRSLILCLERDPYRCHRSLLGERLESEGIPTRHLGTTAPGATGDR